MLFLNVSYTYIYTLFRFVIILYIHAFGESPLLRATPKLSSHPPGVMPKPPGFGPPGRSDWEFFRPDFGGFRSHGGTPIIHLQMGFSWIFHDKSSSDKGVAPPF